MSRVTFLSIVTLNKGNTRLLNTHNSALSYRRIGRFHMIHTCLPQHTSSVMDDRFFFPLHRLVQPCYKNLVACDTHSRSKVTHHDFPTNLKTKVVFIFILISSLNILYPLHLPLYKLIIQISIAKNINSIIRKKCRDAKETHYTHLDTVL